MVEPRFRWQFPRALPIDAEFLATADGLGLRPRLTELLWGRGAGAGQLASFVAEPSGALCDPALLPDAAAFVQRIEAARAGGERVLVFGDFDADGLTGLAILMLALRRLGVDVVPYVPDRVLEGHGLSAAAIEAAVAVGARVIVTVDCGTSSREEVAAAATLGIDVLITDHHRMPLLLPPAVAIVNPQRADSDYPHRTLSGSGVAFKLAQLLLGSLPGGESAALAMADLAAIGTVADLAPVLGENRAIARIGLERMRSAPRPGLAALLAAAGIDPAAVDLETVAFAIAPRLNAAGRIGDARVALDLLVAEDTETATLLAGRLDAANLTRRQLTRDAVSEAEAAIAASAADADGAAGEAVSGAGAGAAVVVRGPWSVGIVGLVASRLSERRARPAVVGAQLDGFVRASCRSGPGFDLAAALEDCADLLTRHGGHAGAAGFEIPDAAWDTFVERFQGLAAATERPDPRPSLSVDLAVRGPELDYALVRDLAKLEPTGPGNPSPLIAVLDLTVTRVRAASGGHAQLTLRRRTDVIDAIAFDRGDLVESVREGDVLDIVARVVSRTFGGYESLQLEVRDVATAGTVRPGAARIAPDVAPDVSPDVAPGPPALVGALA